MAQDLWDYLQQEKINDNLEEIKYQNERLYDLEQEKIKLREEEETNREKRHKERQKKETETEKRKLDKTIGVLFKDIFNHDCDISKTDLHLIEDIKQHITNEYNKIETSKYKKGKHTTSLPTPDYEDEPKLPKVVGWHLYIYFLTLITFTILAYSGYSLLTNPDNELMKQIGVGTTLLAGALIMMTVLASENDYDQWYWTILGGATISGILLRVGFWIGIEEYVMMILGIIGIVLLIFYIQEEINKISTLKSLEKELPAIKARNSKLRSAYNKERNALTKKAEEEHNQSIKYIRKKHNNQSSKKLFTVYYLGKTIYPIFQLMAKQYEQERLHKALNTFLDLFDVNVQAYIENKPTMKEIMTLKSIKS